MRLGVFLPNWIGDVVMATPALRALRKHVGQHGQLIGIMRPYVADVLAGTGWLDETIFYTKRAGDSEFSRRRVRQNLRAAQLDAVLLLTNSFRTAWMAWQSRASERIGYVGGFRRFLLSHRITPQTQKANGLPLPTIDSYLQLATAIGCRPEPPRMELATLEADERAADDVWRQLALPAGERVVVLNSGGAFGAAKHWPAEHFAQLARRIVANGPYTVLVNCGPAEREIAVQIVAQANDHRVVSLAGIEQVPIGLTKACIRRSRMLVTTDSGPRYFGMAFEKPVVTLFGPTDPRSVETHYARETSLALGLDCQPCMARACPLAHHRCMRDLSVDRVYDAVVMHLNAARAEEAA